MTKLSLKPLTAFRRLLTSPTRALSLSFLLGTVGAFAQEELVWSPSGAGNPPGGAGVWNQGSARWTADGGATYQAWPAAGRTTAIFDGAGATVTLADAITAAGLDFRATGYTIAPGSGSLNLVLRPDGFPPTITVRDRTHTASILAPLSGSDAVYFTGAGTVELAGANTVTGNLYIAGATVLLKSASGSLDPSNGLEFGGLTSGQDGGGAFILDNTGATGATSQTLSGRFMADGDVTIESRRVAAQETSLILDGFYDRSVGATVNYRVIGGTNGNQNKIQLGFSSGFIDQGSFFGGNQFAWVDAAGFVRGINYGSDSGAVSVNATTSRSSTDHLRVNGAISAQNTGTFRSILVNGAHNITISNNRTVTVDGLLKAGGNASTISGGTIRAGEGQDLVIRTDQATDQLTISSVIADNNGSALVKTGSGTLVLNGNNNSYSGGTFLNAGVLSVASLPTGESSNGSIGTGPLRFTGGTLLYTGATGTSAREFFAMTGGGELNISAVGTTLTLNGKFSGPGTDLASDQLVKKGPGTLVLGGTEDNSGLHVAVHSGTLRLAKSSGNFLNAVGGLTIKDGATAQLAGTGNNQISNEAVVVVESGGLLDLNGRNESIDGLSGAGTVTNTSTGSNSRLVVGAWFSPTSTFSGVIQDGSGGRTTALRKIGEGTQTLSGSSTYSGGTTVSDGMLVAAHNRAVGSGTVTIGGGTFHVENGVEIDNAVVLTGGTYSRDFAGDLSGAMDASSDLAGGVDTTARILAGTVGTTTLVTSFSRDNDAFSDVYHLEGTGSSAFVLELSFAALQDGLTLGWLDGEDWVDAVAGNTGNMATEDMQGFAGSYAAFQAIYGSNLESTMGAYGTETAGGLTKVWAVLNHNSEFAAIPEPASSFLVLGGLTLVFLRRRTRMAG